eukprot:m.11446 g.11446  ORF g.11446 m.11446 type:complete len:194 (+) comp4007_c0_seq1:143-724(+)
MGDHSGDHSDDGCSDRDEEDLADWEMRVVTGDLKLSRDRTEAYCKSHTYSGNVAKLGRVPLGQGAEWLVTLKQFNQQRSVSSIYCGVISADNTKWWSLCSDGDGLYRHGNRCPSLPDCDWTQAADAGERWHFSYMQDDADVYTLRIRRESADLLQICNQIAFANLPGGLAPFFDLNIKGDIVSVQLLDQLPPK